MLTIVRECHFTQLPSEETTQTDLYNSTAYLLCTALTSSGVFCAWAGQQTGKCGGITNLKMKLAVQSDSSLSKITEQEKPRTCEAQSSQTLTFYCSNTFVKNVWNINKKMFKSFSGNHTKGQIEGRKLREMVVGEGEKTTVADKRAAIPDNGLFLI